MYLNEWLNNLWNIYIFYEIYIYRERKSSIMMLKENQVSVELGN